jgi:hypothetical protein
MPTKFIATYGIKATNLISASLTPLFLAVALIETQSPTTKAKLTNPTCAGENRYGGAANT